MASASLDQFKYSKVATAAAVSAKSKEKKYQFVKKVGDKYFINGKEIIFTEDKEEFLSSFYDNPETGFQGRDRMFAKIYAKYAGISRRDVMEFLKNLETAQIHAPIKKVPVSRPLVLRKPNVSWAIDLTFLSKFNQESIVSVEKEKQILLTIIDLFSRYAFAVILPNKSGKVVADAFDKILAKIAPNTPSTIRTDNGSEFKAGEFQKVLKKYGIRHIFSEPYSPTQNSVIERLNRTLKMSIYKFLSQWNQEIITDDDLEKLVKNYNSTIHRTILQAPDEVHFGDAGSVSVAKKAIKVRAETILSETRKNFPTLKVGDYVRVSRDVSSEFRKSRTFKRYAYLKNWFYELYQVVQITRPTPTKNSRYVLMDDETKQRIPRYFLRQHLLKIDKANLIVPMERDEYVVEEVIGKKGRGANLRYLVRFHGYSTPEYVRPQPEFRKLIDAFEKKIKK